MHTDRIRYRGYLKTKLDGKTYVSYPWMNASFRDFIGIFLKQLKFHILHAFIRRKQYHEKHVLLSKINNQYIIPENILILIIDFIASYHLKSEIMTSSMGTSLFEISYLVMYEKCVRNNQLQQQTFNIFSDKKMHGWQSFIPAFRTYLIWKQKRLDDKGNQCRCIILHSDRGPHDFFIAPSHVYLHDLAKKFKITINHNVGASQHNKGIADQAGGTVKSFLDREMFCGNLVPINDGSTMSSQLVKHCVNNFSFDKNKNIRRHFWEMPAQFIHDGNSPFDSFAIGPDKKGISKYHCALIDGTGIKYRVCSCFCSAELNSLFAVGSCRQQQFCGDWKKLNEIPEHVTFKRLREDYNKEANKKRNKNRNR